MVAESHETKALVQAIGKQLRRCIRPDKAAFYPRFFKTAPGQYGEGDRFLGVVVPDIRCCARQFKDAPAAVLAELLHSVFHEERMTALIIMVMAWQRGDAEKRQEMHALYLKHMECVNSWDLVDISTPTLVGAHLQPGDRSLLYQWVGSNNLWRRRIAIVATLQFIRQGELADTFRLAECLLHDKHDLIHKAVGWMLREAGKRDLPALEHFLNKYAAQMPRTMLRYSLERLPQQKRQVYMKAKAAKITAHTSKNNQ